MRLSTLVYPFVTFLIAGILALLASRFSVQLIEDHSVVSVRRALSEQSLSWADADANGLQVFVIGTAPNEAQRFRALSVAGGVVDAARLIDQMNVQDSADIAPPRFSLEILRNDSGVSLIGLIPAESDREELREIAQRLAGNGEVSDLLETADYPSPENWREALDFAMSALKDLPSSKISVSAEEVTLIAMSDSEKAKRELEAKFTRKAPAQVRLAMKISAPRPVISPFTLRFLIDAERGARFDACSADTPEARDRILKAAKQAGLKADVDCKIGLGVPTRSWGQAAERAIGAVEELEGGTVTFSDADISLIALEGTDQAKFDRVVGELEASLPEVFVMPAELPVPEVTAQRGPAEFVATRSPEGMVQLRGRLNSETARVMVDSFSRANFGSGVVHMAARVDDTLSPSWSVRVLAGLESLSFLSNGAVTVSPTSIEIRGNTGTPDASAQIAALLSEKLGEGEKYDIDVTYQEKLNPIADQPSPEQCETAIAALVGQRKINFEPGSANLDAEARGILDDIAEILKQCGDLRLEIGGHTDSQGRESMNQQLSQARAQSVLNELRSRRVLTSSYTAKGYGEEQPIADNKTEDGREANRRIEFKLIRPKPVKEVQTALESQEQSVDEEAQTEAAQEETDEQN